MYKKLMPYCNDMDKNYYSKDENLLTYTIGDMPIFIYIYIIIINNKKKIKKIGGLYITDKYLLYYFFIINIKRYCVSRMRWKSHVRFLPGENL